MNLASWVERNGVARVSAYRRFHGGRLSVSPRRAGRLILVNDGAAATARHGRTAVYARASSANQKADVDRQGARVTAWATAEQMPVDKVVTEVGSERHGHRRKFLALLRGPSVGRSVAEHRDRFCRFGCEHIEAALAAQGREVVVVDSSRAQLRPGAGNDQDPHQRWRC